MRISDWSSDVCSSDLAVVDGTASSLTGVDQAVAYAGLYDAALTIVVVTENLAWAAAVDPMAYATAMEVSDAQRKEHVVAVRKRAEGAPVHVEDRKSTRLNSSH